MIGLLVKLRRPTDTPVHPLEVTPTPHSTPTHPPPPSHTSLTGIHLVNHALGDRYEILEEIGRGGMATVYKAIQKSLKRPVALKVVHQNLLHDTEFVSRFHREAQLCASLNHPNIVTVHDEGEVSGVHFMAMEYLEGTDLHRLIRSRGRLTPEQTLQYLLPVAEALDYAHGRGYIHRDIKSANIFITGSGRVVLMDFGIAHAAAGTQLTRAGTVIGTPEYMSPEQAEGKKVDHRTDLYSLGVVMYECLAGRVPFKGDNAASIIYKLVHEQVDASGLTQSPASMQTLIKALLSKQATRRPASARSIAEGMKLLQHGKAWTDVERQTWENNDIPKGPGEASGKSPDKPAAPRDKQKVRDHTIRVGGGGTGGNKPPSAHPGASRRKKVPPVVWVLLLIGVVLGGVLINHVITENRQQQEAQLEQSAWQQADRRNTIDAYNQYLREYPRGIYSKQAESNIKKIQEEEENKAWHNALNINTKSSFETYLADYPNGTYAAKAKKKIDFINSSSLIYEKLIQFERYSFLRVIRPNGSVFVLSDNSPSKPKISPNQKNIAFIAPLEWEMIGSVYIYNYFDNALNEIVSDRTIKQSYKPKKVYWLDDKYLILIIGYAYGTVSAGGSLYVYNTQNYSLSEVYNPGNRRNVLDLTVENDKIHLEIIEWDENYMNRTKIFKTIQGDTLKDI